MATPVGLEPTTCRLEGGCSIQLSYGAVRRRASTSMGPGADAVELEIVGIGDGPPPDLVRLLGPVGDALALGIGYGFFLRIKPKAELLTGIARTGPAHQGLDLTGLVLLEDEKPL